MASSQKSQSLFSEASQREWGEPFDFITGISRFPKVNGKYSWFISAKFSSLLPRLCRSVVWEWVGKLSFVTSKRDIDNPVRKNPIRYLQA